MSEKCLDCKHFSGLQRRPDPFLLEMHSKRVQLDMQINTLHRCYDLVEKPVSLKERFDDGIDDCYNMGGTCMRFPATGKSRPVIWDGDDWCGEWQEKAK